MKTTQWVLTSSLLVVLTLCIATAFGQDCPSQGGIVISPGQGVTFSQVTFSFKDVSDIEPSGTGRVQADVSQLRNLMSSGFINVITDSGWVTQNLPILPGFYDQYGYTEIGTTFDLGVDDGIGVTTLDAYVCYTPSPVMSPPSGTELSFDVGSTEYNAQGECPGDTDFGYGGSSPGTAACKRTTKPTRPPVAGIVFPGGVFKFQLQRNHPNVETADNQCAPAAFANNFTWLKNTYGITIPQNNVIGLRGAPANSLVGTLDLTMWSGGVVAGRAANERPDGDAVTSFEQLRGYMQYLANNKLNLTLKHQGCSDNAGVNCGGKFDGTNDYKFAGLTSAHQGGVVDPNFIYNEIALGAAVKGGFAHPLAGGGQNAPQDGGHAVSIVGAVSILGVPFIVYRSDHIQTACSVKKKPCPLDKIINDDKGTGEVDISWLTQNPPIKICPDRILNGQPVAVFDFNGCDSLTNIMTQKP